MVRPRHGNIAVLAVAALLSACVADVTLAGPPDGSVRPVDAGPDAGPPDTGIDVGPIDATLIHTPSGLPCDVAGVFGRNCTVCHTSPPQGGAPRSFLTREDLIATVPTDPSKSFALFALERMMTNMMPPPPTDPVTPAEIAIVQAWVAAGTPPGSCPTTTTTTPYDGHSICTSGTSWSRGDAASAQMHPGRACIACHRALPTPPPVLETMAGTVYRSIHEPDDCNGESGVTNTITISVMDHQHHVITAVANDVGNFSSTAPIMLPILSATVTYVTATETRTRVMASPQLSADCNSCHTEGGGGANGAPGRILLP